MQPLALKVEEKLFQNRYKVDEGRPHIRVKPHTKPSEALAALVKICPAGCYSRAEGGQIEVTPDGCLECGTCQVGCPSDALKWVFPRGGFGVIYRQG